MLDANRLYRETAQQNGDAALADVLEDLERVLMDVAHSPQEITPAKLESLQKLIEARDFVQSSSGRQGIARKTEQDEFHAAGDGIESTREE